MFRLLQSIVATLTRIPVNSVAVGRGIPEPTSAQPESAGPSGVRTQGGGVAALLARPRTKRRAVSAAFGCVLVAMGLPLSAAASTPIYSFAVSPSTTQAGGHPNLSIRFTLGSRTENPPGGCGCEDAKTIVVKTPPGLIGNPHATPQCTISDFSGSSCPVDSQVGLVFVRLAGLEAGHGFFAAVYNLEPFPGTAGLLAFDVPLFEFPIFLTQNSRTESDYGLTTTTAGISHLLPLEVFELTLFGVPASPANDAMRVPLGWPFADRGDTFPPTPSNSPEEPFLDNPTSCGVPLSASLEVVSYDGGTSHAQTSYPRTAGCDRLSFNPSLSAEPTTEEADSASGLDVDLSVPQLESPTTPSPSEIKEATVTLPPGFSINPNAADGKAVCSTSQAQFETPNEAQCPEDSKVGSLTIESSALPGPLPGYVYLGQPQTGERYRLWLVADGFGLHVKLPGTVTADPQTGQLEVFFRNLPQTPFTNFNLHFFGSERGLLATPTRCGTYPVTSTFTPWDNVLPDQSSTQFFTLASGPDGTPCPMGSRPFVPTLLAGVTDGSAAAHTTFSLDLTRPDGDQNLRALNLTAPPGFSATLAGIPYCSDAFLAQAASPAYSGSQEQASPSCPAASQVGTSVAGAGAGTHPVYLSGKVYLAGPYKGAPLSLAVITPAVSGPYDLGNVVVRAALHVNPETAQVSAISDPLPQILEGIPLRLRSVLIELNRPGFALNPTNCDPFSVAAEIFGDEGAMASLTNNFQVANCASLSFAPKLAVSFTGSTKLAGTPALQAVLTYPKGGSYANIASTSVTLPPTEQIDNAHLNSPCTRVQFAANACPASSVIGTATAVTPLLEKPLEGPVYLMTGFGHKLPDLVVALKGQIDIVLDGHVDTVHKAVRTTFATVPDAPVSKFTLNLDGGNKGLLQNNTNLCMASLHVGVKMDGQNGKSVDESPEPQTPCGARGKKHKRHLNRAKEVR